MRSAQLLARRRSQIDAYLRAHSVRKLQLGTGSDARDGWLNTDIHQFPGARGIVYLDARKRFPLPDESFDLVYSEHMIEHLTYAEGLHCLRECRRVLRRGGRIRVATPSLERLGSLYSRELTDVQRRYIAWAVENVVEDDEVGELPGYVVNNFFRAWGHRFIYDEATLRLALEHAGFADIQEFPVGESNDEGLAGLESHLAETPDLNAYETIALEARRP